ncbi:metallophosphoesterase family protein [Evansella tamaricis]|uniref:Phosphoesterase n=1 Tax=Evansella tamaricis TaxID=2069301 RepID=A0ABS6JF51_9BACI|nr:metallophosphoesterase family protein [Evansella tamaricis]MBU9712143.1 metallophosphoesterase [Evansella tamaricis]
MKIVVVSDTHMPNKAIQLPNRLVHELTTADQIIHAGDWQTIDVYKNLEQYAPVSGVAGNVDGSQIKELFPDKTTICVNGFQIGIVHGHGMKKTTEKRAEEAFETPLDCIVFGHSHIPYLRYAGKTLLFNPGSATDKRKLPFYSFGVLTVTEEIRAEHIFYKQKE